MVLRRSGKLRLPPLVIGLDIRLGHDDFRADLLVDQPVLEQLLLDAHAVVGHAQPLQIEHLLEGGVAQLVDLLYFLNGRVDFGLIHLEPQARHLLGGQFFVDQLVEHCLAPFPQDLLLLRFRHPLLAHFSLKRGHGLFEFGKQDNILIDNGGDAIHCFRPGLEEPAPPQNSDDPHQTCRDEQPQPDVTTTRFHD